MRFKSLSALRRRVPLEIELDSLPDCIAMSLYAKQKVFTICKLVREIHGGTFEWYGFTLAHRSEPELVTDIGLPKNAENVRQYTRIAPEQIAAFRETFPEETIINGWVHSHADLEFKRFSGTDEQNHETVLGYVASQLKKPVAKKEIIVKDLVVLNEGKYSRDDLNRGSVVLISDGAVQNVRLFETVHGSFCYCVVVGDDGWHKQEIFYRRRGVLTGEILTEKKEAEIVVVDTGKEFSIVDAKKLATQIKEKINPISSPPPEKIERM